MKKSKTWPSKTDPSLGAQLKMKLESFE